MKKGLTAIAALALMALVATSCSKQKDENQGVEETVGVVEGEIVDMPDAGTDSGEIAAGEAVAVEETAPQQDTNQSVK